MTEARLIYMTVKDRDEAELIGKTLLEERLVACVNLIDSMESMFWWDGKVQQQKECFLLAKTEAEFVDTIIERVHALHSYECPCVVALPIENGNPAFLDWVHFQTRSD
jgi:periplasmic divalent cation tolerance protein